MNWPIWIAVALALIAIGWFLGSASTRLDRPLSRPYAQPATVKFAVKVINHYGDEVLKVFEV